MKRILIIGAGDLGQQIAHYVSEISEYEIIGYVDDWATVGNIRRCYPVLGCIDDTEELYRKGVYDELLIGIGYKHFETRKQLFERFHSIIPFATYVHPNCVIDRTAKIGEGVVMLSNNVISMDAHIGNNVFMYSGSRVGNGAIINSHCILSLSVLLGGYSEIEEKCFCGIGSTIIDNVRVANSNFIGARSNVVKNITDSNGIYAGNPARLLRQNK